MKRAELEKLKGKTITLRAGAASPARFGAESAAASRRERREHEQAQGLVPFAVKLNSDLVRQLQGLARERGTGMNELVEALLKKALAG
ncbi:MAG: ribbon-helix-helix protein, CopG family [Burkholderiales bacterium]|nr:ribbon-helix-helix protein, CopG family [Burkholderiales bacterium]